MGRANPDHQLFQDLGQKKFESFSLALHEASEGLSGGRLYAPDGEQFGIDHIVNRGPGQGIEVGQSKDYATFSRAQITSAADAFMAHWETRWRGLDVKRFILFTACEVKAVTAADEVLKQQRRFGRLGLSFELWDAARILEKLAAAPQIIRRHLGERAHEQLFGKTGNPLDGLTTAIASGDRAALDATLIVSRLGSAEQARLEAWQRRVRGGEGAAVASEIEAAATGGADERALSPGLRAAERRLLAGIVLVGGDVGRARTLADEADALDGTSDRLRAMILMEEAGPQAVLDTFHQTDVEIAEVRAVAWMRLERADEAESELRDFATGAPRAETLRLLALSRLLAGRRAEAVETALAATGTPQAHRSCRVALAVCLYARALSPAAPVLMTEFPQPIDTAMVQVSDQATRDLVEAARIFGDLAETAEARDRDGLRCWLLASLANARLRDEAQALLDRWSADGEWSSPLIVWALARGLVLDRSAATAWTTSRIVSKPTVESLLAALVLASAASDAARIRKLLDRHGGIFERAGEGRLLAYWRAASAVRRRGAPEFDPSAQSPGLRLRLAANEKPSRARGDLLIELLTEQLAGEGDPDVVLGCVQLLAEAGLWSPAAAAAGYLTDGVGTAEARSLAARCLYRAGEPGRALEALDAAAYPSGVLPVDEARLQAACLAMLGRAPDARVAFQTLARVTRDPGDVRRAIEYDIDTGNVRKARALYDQNEDVLAVPTGTHLRLANALAGTDAEGAARLVRRLAEGAEGAAAAALFEISTRLGLADVAGKAVAGIVSMAGQPGSGVHAATIAEVAAMISDRHEAVETVTQLHLRGRLPVHALARFSLAGIALRLLDPLLSPPPPERAGMPILARFGRRFDETPWSAEPAKGVVRADVTALLTAHGLGMLDRVERAFAPIAIAPMAVTALQAIHQDLLPLQPLRLAAIRRVLELVEFGVIAERTIGDGGRSVEWQLPGEAEGDPVNLGALVDQIVERPGVDRDAAIAALGRTIDEPAGGDPLVDGERLRLPGGMAITLAEAGLLETAAKAFDIAITPEDRYTMASEAAVADARAPVARSVGALAQRVAEGISDGRYRLLPFRKAPTGETDELMGALEALTTGPFADGELLWADDRLISAFGGAPPNCVTTVEVLTALESRKELTPGEADALRQRLRRARWLFVPIGADEVVRHLRRAVADGAVTATADLADLQRGVGEILLQRRLLQWPAPAQLETGERGEAQFLLDMNRVAGDTLSAIWRDPDWTPEDADAASGWIMEHLDTGFFPLPVIAAGDPRSDDLLGLHLSGLMMAAVEFLPRKGESERREAMLSWLWHKVVDPMLAMRPNARGAFLTSLEQFFVEILGKESGDAMARNLLGLAINAFPAPVRKLLLSRPSLRAAFALTDRPGVGVGSLSFSADEFHRTMLETGRDGSATATDEDGVEVVFRLEGEGNSRGIALTGGDVACRVDDWPLRIADDAVEIREAALGERSVALDLPPEQFEELRRELRELDPLGRIIRVNERLLESPEQFYARLANDIAERVPFQMPDFFPDDIETVLRSLRMDAGDTGLDAAAGRLIGDRGVATAIRRLACLPVEPPKAAVAAVATLPEDEWLALMDELVGDRLPWTLSFAAALHRARPVGGEPMAERLASAIRAACSPDGLLTIACWTGAASFVEQHGPTLPGWAEMGALRQLATCWYHAGRIATVVARGGVKRDAFVDAVAQYRRASPRAIVEPITAFQDDRAAAYAIGPHKAAAYMFASSLVGMVADGDAEAERLLANLLVESEEEEPSARIEVAVGALAGHDALCSVFSRRIDEDIANGAPGAEVLFGEALQRNAAARLAAASDWEQRGLALAFVRHVTGDGKVPSALSGAVSAVIDTLDRDDVPPDSRLVVSIHAAQLAHALGKTPSPQLRGFVFDEQIDGIIELRCELALAVARALPLDERLIWFASTIERLGRLHNDPSPMRLLRSFARGLSGNHAAPFIDSAARLECGHDALILSDEAIGPPSRRRANRAHAKARKRGGMGRGPAA